MIAQLPDITAGNPLLSPPAKHLCLIFSSQWRRGEVFQSKQAPQYQASVQPTRESELAVPFPAPKRVSFPPGFSAHSSFYRRENSDPGVRKCPSQSDLGVKVREWGSLKLPPSHLIPGMRDLALPRSQLQVAMGFRAAGHPEGRRELTPVRLRVVFDPALHFRE